MKFIFTIAASFMAAGAFAQNVGIGITSPIAGLHIVNDNGVVASGTLNAGTVLNESSEGSRFIFNVRKGAIRGGYLNATGAAFWNDASTGFHSVGFGYNAKASGYASVAIGQQSLASQTNSLALGYDAQATAANSVALGGVSSYAKAQFAVSIGNNAYANTYGSVALGRNVNAGYPTIGYGENTYAIGIGDHANFSTGGHYATGDRSFVFGNNCRTVGIRAFALGNDCSAGFDFYDANSGRYAFAFGNSCVASGIFSFAFGNNANTNQKIGAMVLGSRVDGVAVLSPSNYHFLAQFAGGYQLQSNNAGSLGVYLNPNTSAWASLCDSNKKEDVLPMDDDNVLKKFSSLQLSSWKYKDDPEKTNRHYGIMAQDFYEAFGTDAMGKIGNDTLVNPIDLLGVAYSAIKALEKKVSEMQTVMNENQHLKARLERLESLLTARISQ